MTEVQQVYIDQGLEVIFACFEQDGVTPFNCVDGSATFHIWRHGLRPFDLLCTDPQWVNQSLGKGKFIIDKNVLPSGIGLYQYELQALNSIGRPSVQRGWLRMMETR